MTQFLVKGVTVFGGEVKCKLYCFSISHFCVQFTQWPDSITLGTLHRRQPHITTQAVTTPGPARVQWGKNNGTPVLNED